jgi:hypothetical protein
LVGGTINEVNPVRVVRTSTQRNATHAMDGWMDEWMCIPLTVRRRRRRRITNDVTVASVFPVSVSSVSDSVGTINQINQSISRRLFFPVFRFWLAGWSI